MGDYQKNTKGKWSHQKKKGWTPKAIATPKCEGCIEELKGHVFDLHGLYQSERFNQSINEITKYVDQDLDTLTGKTLRDIKVTIISKPNNTELAQG